MTETSILIKNLLSEVRFNLLSTIFKNKPLPFNFKVSEEFYWQLKDLAVKKKCLMVEIIEKSLEFYQQSCSESSQPSDKELEKYVKVIEYRSKTKPQQKVKEKMNKVVIRE